MALTDVITSFATGTYTITRRGAGTYSAGVLVPASTSTETGVVMCIQPATGRMLQAVPEAQSGKETKVAYTTTSLMPRTPNAAGDLVTIGSEAYECIRCEPWQEWGLNHYRAFLERQVNGP